MKSELPVFNDRTNICIICEGPEEYDYLNKLNSLGVWNDIYNVSLDNANGNGNIAARYQDRFQNGSYDMIFVFCDTDRKPFEQYEDIKRKINEFHGVDNASEAVIIYSNPCTMQIILQHLDDVALKSPAKRVNAPLIKALTGIDNYKARKDQRQQLMAHITTASFYDMLERVNRMSNNDSELGSSNFGKLVTYLTSESDGWIREIESQLEE